MSTVSFCTCPDLKCPHHPQNHDNGCTPCIAKNLHAREIPACFWFRIGAADGADSPYTFEKFADAVRAGGESA